MKCRSRPLHGHPGFSSIKLILRSSFSCPYLSSPSYYHPDDAPRSWWCSKEPLDIWSGQGMALPAKQLFSYNITYKAVLLACESYLTYKAIKCKSKLLGNSWDTSTTTTHIIFLGLGHWWGEHHTLECIRANKGFWTTNALNHRGNQGVWAAGCYS